MTYEFQNTLFRTERDMLNAIASEWLSADGANNRVTMQSFLTEMTDEELARECISAWDLDRPESDDNEQTWMQKRGITVTDIEQAFAGLRANFDKAFPANAA